MPTHATSTIGARLSATVWLGAAGASISGVAHVASVLKALLSIPGSLLVLQVMTAVGLSLSFATIGLVLPLLNKIDAERVLPMPAQGALIRSMSRTERICFWAALVYVNILGVGMIIGIIPMFFTALLSAFGLGASLAGALYGRQLIRLRNV